MTSLSAGENHTASPSELDVQSVDTLLLAFGGSILGSQHCSIRGGFISISLDLHATRHTRNCLTTARKQVSALGYRPLRVTALCWTVGFGHGTNLMSVIWTKVSLKEAKMRATPNTSSYGKD